MALYVGTVSGFLGPNAAGHLLTASLMSAPAAIMIAKIMIPETETPATLSGDCVPSADEGEQRPTNLMDAAARGGIEGFHLALSVVALLIAFVALVKAGNSIVSFTSLHWLSFEELVGCCCWPIATGMGIPFDESIRVGVLIGQKTVANEFVAYQSLAGMMAVPGNALSPRTALMMSYGLCGFANLGSVAIMIAGIGGMAAMQRSRLATLGLLSIVSGSLAAFMTACLAGVLG
jgi:CNT family concentrative nucleoside transporter